MKNAGIICEYNPLHGGHKYMIEKLRSAGAERVICLMSGNAVQRGDFAILPKDLRARAALAAGADAVFELPFPYSASGAEFFARAGVDILSRLGVDTIAFGSESCNIEKLKNAAEKSEAFTPSEDKNIGTAEDFFAAIGCDLKSNDILGAEYIKAAKALSADVDFYVIKREGAGYHESSDEGAFPSATEIRGAISAGKLDEYTESQLPYESRLAIEEAIADGCAPASASAIESALLAFWRTCDISAASECAECGGGVAQRLSSAAKEAASLDEMMRLSATKRYTYSRLRRALLFGITGVRIDDLKARAAYVNLLAANAAGLSFVRSASKRGEIEIVSKPSKIPHGEDAAREFELSSGLDALYTLAMPRPRAAGSYLKKSPVIEE